MARNSVEPCVLAAAISQQHRISILAGRALNAAARIFHNTTTDDAGRAVAALVERTIPSVWQVDSLFRILDTELLMRDQTLLHLYRSTEPLTERDLVTWTEHSNASVYRRDVLRPLHRSRFIEYNEHERRVSLSPKGIAEAERILAERA